MNKIQAERIPGFSARALVGKAVKESHAGIMVKNDTVVYIDGSPQILYTKLKFDLSNVLWACQNMSYKKDMRTMGMISNSSIFGFMPRRPLYHDYCHAAASQIEFPKATFFLEQAAQQLAEIYAQYFPEVYAKHQEIAERKILASWRMNGGNSIFSSGIVNKDNQLPYHKDAGNFPGVYSNMIGLKNGIGGGHLICPEYGLKFEIADGSLLIFNGQEILHGVSPIIKKSEDSYRYTVVYYTMQQMWKCLPLKEEIGRIRQVKASREEKRAKILKTAT